MSLSESTRSTQSTTILDAPTDDTASLPVDLERALETLHQASMILATGRTANVAFFAWLACERLAIWIPQAFPGQSEATSHDGRMELLARFLPFDLNELRALHEARKIDAYGNTAAGSRRRHTLRRSGVERALEIARRAFLALSSRLPQGQAIRIRRALTEALALPPPIETVFGMVDRAIVLGQLGAPIDAHLDGLIVRYAQPWTQSDSHYAIWAAQLAANRAMQRGEYESPGGALIWAAYSLRLCRDRGDSMQRVHLHTIQSICFRRLRQFARAREAVALAYRAAGQDERARQIVANQEALLLARSGQLADSRRRGVRLLEQAEAGGNPDLIGRRHFTLGIVLALDGRLDDAEPHLAVGVERIAHENISAQCYSALGHMFLYESRGDLDGFHRYAMVLAKLATQKNLTWHLERANAALARLTGEKRGSKEDVF